MEPWELAARESIRDLVVRYNANGDAGRFEQVLELFDADAAMELEGGRTYTGHEEIRTIFTGAKERVNLAADAEPVYVRHMTATHQIDVVDRSNATGRCYFQVLTRIGLDHWGRYVDRYRLAGDRWVFAHRRVTIDGRSPASVFLPG